MKKVQSLPVKSTLYLVFWGWGLKYVVHPFILDIKATFGEKNEMTFFFFNNWLVDV